MAGKAPKQKGDRLERHIVKLLNEQGIPAKRVPLSGSTPGFPGDVMVTLFNIDRLVECKSRRDFKQLYQWLENRDALILKGDRKEPLLVLRLADVLTWKDQLGITEFEASKDIKRF